MGIANLGQRLYLVYPAILAVTLLLVARLRLPVRLALVAGGALVVLCVEMLIAPGAFSVKDGAFFAALLLVPFCAVMVCLQVLRDLLTKRRLVVLVAVPVSYYVGLISVITAAMAIGLTRP